MLAMMIVEEAVGDVLCIAGSRTSCINSESEICIQAQRLGLR